MQAANAPDINIICEKVAFDGVTRFEDRYRLPLGVTVNITDYSAQMATEVPSGISTAYLLSLLLGHMLQRQLLCHAQILFLNKPEGCDIAAIHCSTSTHIKCLICTLIVDKPATGPLPLTN